MSDVDQRIERLLREVYALRSECQHNRETHNALKMSTRIAEERFRRIEELEESIDKALHLLTSKNPLYRLRAIRLLRGARRNL